MYFGGTPGTIVSVADTQIIAASPSFAFADENKFFQESRTAATEMIAELKKLEARFDKIRDEGFVEFNDVTFPRRKGLEYYISLVKREETSRMLRQRSGGLAALKEKLSTVIEENDHSYDITAVEIHGSPDFPKISIAGTAEDRATAIAALAKIAAKGEGEYVLVSRHPERVTENAYYTPVSACRRWSMGSII